MTVPMFRFDPMELPPEAVALRKDVREFIKQHEDLMGFSRGEFNRDFSRAMGERVITSQYNFAPDDLAYVADHYIFLDHDQAWTSSGGLGYAFGDGTRVGADYLFGSGLRRDGAVPNGASMPAYFQLNLNVSHDFSLRGTGKLHAQLALINALDRTYELRDGTGIGVGAPQYGPRRGLYLSLQKDF